MSVLHFRSLGQSWLDEKDPVVLKTPATRLWVVGHIFEDSHVMTRLFARSTGRAALLWVGGAAGTLIQDQVFLWFLEFHDNWCPPSVVWIQRYLLWFGISHHLCSQFPISPFRLSGQEGQANFGCLPPQNCPSRLVFERMCDSYLKNKLALFLKMNISFFFFFLHKSCVWGEMAQQLRILGALTECQSLVPRTHVEGLTGPVTAAPRDPRSPSGLCGQLHTGVHTHIHVHLHK